MQINDDAGILNRFASDDLATKFNDFRVKLITIYLNSGNTLHVMNFKLKLSLLFGLVFFVHASVYSQFTIEQVLSSPFPSELTASPKGERVAWVFDKEGRRNIWIAEGPQFKARQLTKYNEDDGQELTDLGFSFDGNWIVFVRGGDKNGRGEVPNPTNDATGTKQQVIAVNWASGDVRTIGEGNSPVPSTNGATVVFSKGDQLWSAPLADVNQKPAQLFVARGTVGAPHWSPDGRYLAFSSGRVDHSFIGVYDTVAKTIKYISPSVDRDSAPRWSPDGKSIAFVRRPTNGNQPAIFLDDTPDPWAIYIADLANGAAREIWHSGKTVNDSMPPAGEHLLHWMADGRIVFTSEQDGWAHLYTVSTSGGQAQLLTPGQCEIEDVSYSSDRRTVFYSSNCGDIDRRHLWSVAATGGAPKAITSGERIEWNPTPVPGANSLVYLGSDARSPAMPYSMALNGGPAQMLGGDQLPKDFPSAKLIVPQQVIFKAADGETIHGQLFMPANAKPGAKMPGIVFMHGGPIRQMLLGFHYMYYYHNSYAMNQYLASRGYVVLSVNYRTGIGYGRAFRMAAKRGARGASEYQDVVAAAEYLRNRNDVDSKHIGLWGGSYGGYLTALGLARNSDIFAAGVDMHGVHDWSRSISNANWIDYSNRDAQKIAVDASPIGAITKWRSPVLLIQGDDDRNVAFNQMVDLVHRLREQNVEFEQIVFPDEVHDFLLHRTWLTAYHASSDFFDKHLK
jgi:dipeptidyl aminopeptidase/acylaminoacyl peptidase